MSGQPHAGAESAGRPGAPVVRWLDQEPPLPGTGARTATSRRIPWLPLIAAGVMMLALVQDRRAGLDSTGPVPLDFVGAWHTTAAAYQDRGFTITSDSLWLRLGPEVSIAYPLIGVRERRSPDGVVHTFVYGNSPSVLEMDLQMNPDSTIHLANTPSVLWRKATP